MQLNQSMAYLDHQGCYQVHGTTEQSQGHGGSLGGWENIGHSNGTRL